MTTENKQTNQNKNNNNKTSKGAEVEKANN